MSPLDVFDSVYLWWALAALCVWGFMRFVGRRIARDGRGILIDRRNKVSLSQFQVVLWTVTLGSALVVVALGTLSADIEMDVQLWALMGISLGSAFGSMTVKDAKAKKTPAAAPAATTEGILLTNDTAAKAEFWDMFRTEEAGEGASNVDLPKLQMFVITLVVWAGFVGTVAEALPAMIATADGPVRFPAVSTTMAALLGISHAGYLGLKSVDKTQVKPQP